MIIFFPLGPCKISSKLCPCLVHVCTALPVPASVQDCACVENKEKGNVNILCLHVWLRAGIGVADPIFNLLEKCFNRVLEVDWGCNLIVILIIMLGGVHVFVRLHNEFLSAWSTLILFV
jgi:hypothetical protein